MIPPFNDDGYLPPAGRPAGAPPAEENSWRQTMILLDTDHLSVLVDTRHLRHASLKERIEASADQELAIPIVAAEEQLRG